LEQVTVLVGSSGKWMPPESEEFLAVLGDADPGDDAVGFAVLALGFIRFQVLDRLVTEIELCPRSIELPALLALEQRLKEPGTKLFRIRYFDTEWRSEISASAEHTIDRLRELCAPAPELPSSERFRVEAQDANVLLRDVGNPLRLLTQKWRTSFGCFDASVIALACSHGLLSLMAITGWQEREESPVFRFLGEGHRWASRDYQFAGGRLEEMPDREYGHWAAEFHRAVAASSQPRYDLVTATTQIAQDRGRPKRTLRYERLLLPWRGASGEVLITSCARNGGTDRSANLAPDRSASSVAKYAARSS